jgi:protocatechuate 3,4-dioxygenase beta subunit
MLYSTPEPVQASMPNMATRAPHMVVLTTMESAGPSPLIDILDNRALQRWDITEGRDGIPVTLALQLIDLDNRGEAISGAEVYLCHGNAKDAEAKTAATPLRGVQYTNAAGRVTFRTLYPDNTPGQHGLHVQMLLPSTVPSSRTVSSASTQLRFPQDYHEPLRGKQQAPAYDTLSVDGNSRAGFFASIVIGITSAEA